MKRIRELFELDVTRDIAPVVYFHEQSPDKLAAEVGEYIITGGYPDDHPSRQRVPDGIHEQYLHLLRAISEELDRSGGADLPASWISGFYGSGKSSFAKLLGLALDGVALPDGRSLSEALLARDKSPRAAELADAWRDLRAKIDPVAVVFDIGGLARDNEHIHSVCVRQVQKRLGYCSSHALVADFELNLERDGRWHAFEKAALRVLNGKPWAEAKDRPMAEEDFSHILHELEPERYIEPMSWFAVRAGLGAAGSSAADATRAIADMLAQRATGKTLFLVVDEVSQYIYQDQQRMLRLQSFVSELGQRLKGRVWLLVTGQQRLEETDETHVLGKLKDRFKAKLRVHLATTNIRDVVHKRLLQKTPDAEALLREKFETHRNDLKLFAYECEDITEQDFVEVYPLLPDHIDLLMQITSAMRTRSARSQGDDQAIRGLLQLLGELFRTHALADRDVGHLVTLDLIYDVQHTALDSDVQSTMARILAHCAPKDLSLARRAAKAVALLELIQETVPTTAELVARCLYDRLDRGNILGDVTDALEDLRRANLLGYSEKQGYKIQSSSGEEWERERRDIAVGSEELVEHLQGALAYLMSEPSRPTLQGRAFPWCAYFSDGRRADDVLLVNPRDPAHVAVDLRLLPRDERDPKAWLNKSAEDARLRHRCLWIAEDPSDVRDHARDLARSLAMVRRYKPRKESLPRDRQRLLLEEEANAEELERALHAAVDAAFAAGTFYFQGRSTTAGDFGATFATALETAGNRFLPDLYPSFLATQLSPAELQPLLDDTVSAPSTKLTEELGLLSLDAGRYVPSCDGVAPQRVLELITQEQGVSGLTLLAHFGGPPYGYVGNVVRACAAALLRAGKIRIQPDGGSALTAPRDAGAREVFEKDRGFKRATFSPAEEGTLGTRDINRICKFFQQRLGKDLDREQGAIADAVGDLFPAQAERLRGLVARLRQLPRDVDGNERPLPRTLERLQSALEECVRVVRRTEPTVLAVKRRLDDLNDGLEVLGVYDSELTDDALDRLRLLDDVLRYRYAQLQQIADTDADGLGIDGESDVRADADSIRDQLAGERPWRDLAPAEVCAARIREAYVTVRRRILAHHGELAEAARARIQTRDGFATLTAEHSRHVLRPITEALPPTSDDAVSPSLAELRDRARHALERAEEEADTRLDQLISENTDERPPVRRVGLRLRNREIASTAELDAVLDELREQIEPELERGHRVRIVLE